MTTDTWHQVAGKGDTTAHLVGSRGATLCGTLSASHVRGEADPGMQRCRRCKKAAALEDLPGKAKCSCRNSRGGKKVEHASKKDALQEALKKAHEMPGVPYRPYRCPTKPGVWHLTHLPKRKYKRV